MATLLPLPESTWLDANGTPLASGTVAFYVPNTFVPKDTYQDSAATILNSNPVILDAAGRAIVYGSGSYRQIVKDAAGNTVWDQLTSDTAVGGLAWGGTSTGTPNSQVVASSGFSQQDGQQLSFLVGTGLTNTSGATISPGGASAIAVLKDTLAGPVALTGGELAAGNAVTLIYDQARGAFHLVENANFPSSGDVKIISYATPDVGWLECDGSAISRSTFAALFAKIGTTYGAGNGSTTFNIPETRGYFVRGWDHGAGRDPGRTFGSTQTDAFKSHTHGVTDPGHAHTLTGIAVNNTGSGSFNSPAQLGLSNPTTSTSTTGITNQSTGGTETRPVNIAFMFIIKT